ncbi:MAG: TolC family protein [Rikenellaceae bacterium]|nr:TolC family protein [Rikenellaceae bacterium]
MYQVIAYFGTPLARRRAETEKSMKRLIMTLLVSNFLTLLCVAQPLSIDDCMRYAVENSTSVNKQRLAHDDSKLNYSEAVASLFPAVSGSVGGATNFGRGIDPATNAYTNVTTFSNSYGISGSLPLFAGLQGINTVRAMKVARQRGAVETEIARDEVAIETLSAYMDVVYYTEAVVIAREQLEASRRTLELVRRQFDLGTKSAADVAEIESQEANYDYLLTTEENNLALAYIKLREVMNYPQGEKLEIVTDIDLEALPSATSEQALLDYALANNPKIIASRHATEQSRLNLARAKGSHYPSLYLYGGYNTSYYIDFDNKAAYDPFGTQFRNNRGGYIQLSLSIPIFNGLSARSSKRRAANAYRSAQLEQVAMERAVESEVSQTWQQMQGFGKQYVQGQKKVSAAELAYDGAERKFENGLISALDLQTAANTLLQAKSDKLRARLQYIVKSRMVAYYNGEPLVEIQNAEFKIQN